MNFPRIKWLNEGRIDENGTHRVLTLESHARHLARRW